MYTLWHEWGEGCNPSFVLILEFIVRILEFGLF